VKVEKWRVGERDVDRTESEAVEKVHCASTRLRSWSRPVMVAGWASRVRKTEELPVAMVPWTEWPWDLMVVLMAEIVWDVRKGKEIDREVVWNWRASEFCEPTWDTAGGERCSFAVVVEEQESDVIELDCNKSGSTEPFITSIWSPGGNEFHTERNSELH